jgi:hypothetical protein
MDALLYKVSWGITIYCSYPVYLPKEWRSGFVILYFLIFKFW